MYALVGKNAHPAYTTEINLYHVDAGFFVRFMLPQISLCTQSEILPFLRMARRTGSAVSGRRTRIDAALHLDEQNMRFVFADNIRFEMTVPIIAMQYRISLGKKITAGKILSCPSDLKISHFLLFQRRRESSFCARDTVRSL